MERKLRMQIKENYIDPKYNKNKLGTCQREHKDNNKKSYIG